MELMTLAEYDALMRHDLCAFAQRCFHALYPSRPFDWNWHHDLMAAKLMDCRCGKIKRLIVCLPPKHMKSFFASVVLPTWWLGHDPTAQIICVSYGEGLAEVFARQRLSIMNSPFYQRVFATRLSPHRQSVGEFATTEGGSCFSTSVGGVLTGRGADLIVLDDVLKAEDARSDARRKAVNDWYDDSLVTRLNDQRSGCIVLCMHRLHQDDLVGHVREQESCEELSLPVIAEHNESHLIDTPFGQVCFRRKRGELLHSARMPKEDLDRIRKTVGEYNFAGQYQQAPAPLGGGLIKAEWFPRYRSRSELPTFDQIVQSWDTATRPSELNSFCVCTTWGITASDYYLLHVLRRRLNYTGLKRVVPQHAQAWDADAIVIEDRSSGTQLIEDLTAEGVPAVARYVPKGAKVMRLNGQTAVIENGFVYLPGRAAWLPDFINEITNFPASKHSDQVDSVAQFLDWHRRCRHPAWAWMEAERRHLMSMRTGGTVAPTGGPFQGWSFTCTAPATAGGVRLRRPSGRQGAIVTINGGGPYHPDKDGIIIVPPEHVGEIVRRGYTRV